MLATMSNPHPSTAVDTSDPTALSATELAHQIATRALSARAVVEAHIERIQEVEPRLNAVVVPLFDQAREEADAADAAVRAVLSRGRCTAFPSPSRSTWPWPARQPPWV